MRVPPIFTNLYEVAHLEIAARSFKSSAMPYNSGATNLKQGIKLQHNLLRHSLSASSRAQGCNSGAASLEQALMNGRK